MDDARQIELIRAQMVLREIAARNAALERELRATAIERDRLRHLLSLERQRQVDAPWISPV